MGWFVNKIAADDNGPEFAYSFGLYKTFQHPEIIVFGLPENMMHQLINDIGKQLRGGSSAYRDGSKSSDLLEGYPCEFHHVDPAWYKTTLTWASWFIAGPTSPPFSFSGQTSPGFFHGRRGAMKGYVTCNQISESSLTRTELWKKTARYRLGKRPEAFPTLPTAPTTFFTPHLRRTAVPLLPHSRQSPQGRLPLRLNRKSSAGSGRDRWSH